MVLRSPSAVVIRLHRRLSSNIAPPNRISRSPTSLLDALSSTVGVDPTAQSYELSNDARLEARTYRNRMTYTMAKESGRMAARQIAKEWPTLFQWNRDEPRLDAFRPEAAPDAEMVTATDVETLRHYIDRRYVQAAAQVYTNMRQEGVTLDADDDQSNLLQLLAFFNGDEPFNDQLPSVSLWYSSVIETQPRNRQWKRDGVAQIVFDDMEEKRAIDYNTMILAMCAYGQSGKARDMYMTMRKASMTPDVHAYNALVRHAAQGRVASDKAWENVNKLVEDMKETGIGANEETFAAMLHVLEISKNKDDTLVTKILQNATSLKLTIPLDGLSSALAIYANGLHARDCLVQILGLVESSASSLTGDFGRLFTIAMAICQSMGDVALANRVVEMLQDKGMCLGRVDDMLTLNTIYTSYTTVLIENASSEELVERLLAIMPSQYIPEQPVVSQLLNTLELAADYESITRLWPALLYTHFESRPVIKQMCGLVEGADWAASKQPIESRQLMAQCIRQLVDQLDDESFQSIQMRKGERPHFTYTPMIYLRIAGALCNCEAPLDAVWPSISRLSNTPAEYVNAFDGRTTPAPFDNERDTQYIARSINKIARYVIATEPDTLTNMELCFELAVLASKYADYPCVRTIVDDIKRTTMVPSAEQQARFNALLDQAAYGEQSRQRDGDREHRQTRDRR